MSNTLHVSISFRDSNDKFTNMTVSLLSIQSGMPQGNQLTGSNFDITKQFVCNFSGILTEAAEIDSNQSVCNTSYGEPEINASSIGLMIAGTWIRNLATTLTFTFLEHDSEQFSMATIDVNVGPDSGDTNVIISGISVTSAMNLNDLIDCQFGDDSISK